MIHAYRGVVPKVHLSAWIADSADVIGDVELGEESSVWFSAVIRGDVNFVRVGRGTNLQDGTVLHVNRNGTPTILEDYVTVGHAARLHGCHIKSNCLVGIGAVVLDGAVLEEECVVAAGAVVSPGTLVPKGSVLMGAPARVKRSVTEKDLEWIYRSAKNYIGLAAEYKAARGA
jgi:carbonic anhydrase/acetyltransferase-like protein (isoleucine patch superfamily)